MLIKFADWLSRDRTLAREHRAVVVANDDPSKLQRIKVIIPGILEGPTEYLPWFYQKRSALLGARQGVGSVIVPEVGSTVVVSFPWEDIYFGVYDGEWTSDNNRVSQFDEDYPNSYGFRDSLGNKIHVNKVKKTIEVLHNSGTKLLIKADGSVETTVVGDITLKGAKTENRIIVTSYRLKCPVIEFEGDVTIMGNLTVEGRTTFLMPVTGREGGLVVNGYVSGESGTLLIDGDVDTDGIITAQNFVQG
jgi:phage baseplate assembly protein gpV